MEPGLRQKTPAWRLGSWLLGADLFLSLPMLLIDFSWFFWMVLLALLGLAFTAPHGIARMRGGQPYEPEPTPVTPKAVGAGTYLAFLTFYRLPAQLGDRVFTALWNRIGQVPGRRAAETQSTDATTDWEVVGNRSENPGSVSEAEATEYRVEIEQHLARIAELRRKARDEGIDIK